jgi:hypothetical protein
MAIFNSELLVITNAILMLNIDGFLGTQLLDTRCVTSW